MQTETKERYFVQFAMHMYLQTYYNNLACGHIHGTMKKFACSVVWTELCF